MPAKTAGTHKLTITISTSCLDELQRRGVGGPGEVAALLLESAVRRRRGRRGKEPARRPPPAPLDSWLPEGADPFDQAGAGHPPEEEDNPLNFQTIDRRLAATGRRLGRVIRT